MVRRECGVDDSRSHRQRWANGISIAHGVRASRLVCALNQQKRSIRAECGENGRTKKVVYFDLTLFRIDSAGEWVAHNYSGRSIEFVKCEIREYCSPAPLRTD